MHAATGIEVDVKEVSASQGSHGVTEPADNPGAATGDGHHLAGHHGRAIRLAGFTAPQLPTEPYDAVGPASTGAESDFAHDVPHTDTKASDDETNIELDVSSPGRDRNDRPLHYCVDVPNAEESTYDACNRSVGINPSFHAQLREENEHDILAHFLHYLS